MKPVVMLYLFSLSATMLLVSIHTELGQQLGERYHFEFTPLFVMLDGQGREVWRGSRAPTIQRTSTKASRRGLTR